MDNRQPKLRVFAGPNGSGKSTIIKFIKSYKVNNKPVDFGYYINADEIAVALRKDAGFSFKQYKFDIEIDEFHQIVFTSGLLNENFNFNHFIQSHKIVDNSIHCLGLLEVERLAQIIADYLRQKLLRQKKRFSFETVFSHTSKLDIIREAKNAGYKIYLYFVSTESPEINKFRVKARVKKGGHNVPEDKIESRYYKALDLLYDAAQLAYQAYFFDNSVDNVNAKIVTHFKVIGNKKKWDKIRDEDIPDWFKIYYSEKVKKNKQ